MPPAAAAYILPAIAEIVVSTALGHRILQSRQCSTSDRVALATKLQHHRGLAIRLMADVLATDGMRTSDEMLACVLVFLFAEVSTTLRSFGEASSDRLVLFPDTTIHFILLATTCGCSLDDNQLARRAG